MTAVSAFLQFAKWVLRKKLPLTFLVMLFFLFTIVNGDGSVGEGQWPRASFSGFTVRIPALEEFFRSCNNQILASQWLFTEDLSLKVILVSSTIEHS